MEILEIHENEIKNITQFLIKNEIIFHPEISPIGVPDFTNYLGKDFVLILDRNIFTHFVKLLKTGELKDKHALKVVSSIMAWALFNKINLTPYLALSEYAHFKSTNSEASAEFSLFKNVFDEFPARIWFDLAIGTNRNLPKVSHNDQINEEYLQEFEHFKLHYLEMLHLTLTYLDPKLTIVQKFENYHKWNYENLLICKYTTHYAAMAFGGKSKLMNAMPKSFDELTKALKNQAWDLTYLSLWSTFYYYEDDMEEVFLFATMDNELKSIFKETHKESSEIYFKLFGKILGQQIIDSITAIYQPRKHPAIDNEILDKLIQSESEMLKKMLCE